MIWFIRRVPHICLECLEWISRHDRIRARHYWEGIEHKAKSNSWVFWFHTTSMETVRVDRKMIDNGKKWSAIGLLSIYLAFWSWRTSSNTHSHAFLNIQWSWKVTVMSMTCIILTITSWNKSLFEVIMTRSNPCCMGENGLNCSISIKRILSGRVSWQAHFRDVNNDATIGCSPERTRTCVVSCCTSLSFPNAMRINTTSNVIKKSCAYIDFQFRSLLAFDLRRLNQCRNMMNTGFWAKSNSMPLTCLTSSKCVCNLALEWTL